MDQLLPFLNVLGTYIIANGPNLAGIILPPLIEIINKDIPDERQRFLIACTICFAVAVVFRWDSVASSDPQKFIATLGLIFAESQMVYRLYWKSSVLRVKLNERLSSTNTHVEDEPRG